MAVCWKEEDDAKKHYMAIEEEVGEGVQAALRLIVARDSGMCCMCPTRRLDKVDGFSTFEMQERRMEVGWTFSHGKAWMAVAVNECKKIK